jgi:PEGA domain
MDYLDPKKELRHRIILLAGYLLIAIAIGLTTRLLLLQAYGFGLGKHGAVIQNGLTYFSSQPHPAQIYVNGQLQSSATDTRLFLPAGLYQVRLSRSGYHDWTRQIELQGGDVQHFDYPFLIPSQLADKKLADYSAQPDLLTQSPDRRWLLVSEPHSVTDFQLYDLKNPTKPPVSLSLPASLLSKATGTESLQLEEWADDNQHVVLTHQYDGKSEFILLNRADASQSLNLNTTLSAAPTKLTLNNKKYDRYYLYDGSSLRTASLGNPTPLPVLEHVLAYQTYGNNSVLYVTDNGAPAGKVLVKLLDGSRTYTLRSFPASGNYLLDLTQYSGTLYMALGDSAENKVYVYTDPLGQLQSQPHQALVPAQVLHVIAPSYVSFSANAQFILAEGATQFGVYDIQNTKGYSYVANQPLDAPQVHASWMDGDRLTYVSGGHLVEFDYDHTNPHSLMTASPVYLPAFAPDYKFVYDLVPAANDQFSLVQTSLLAPADR